MHHNCWLCSQEPETINHIIVECSYARQIWFEAANELGVAMVPQPTGTIIDWWETWSPLWPSAYTKGADSLLALIA